eukprot:GHVS01101220.1.p1 GENE.GHVS01101220.1~~GHVS01101220.1.p1  ORF type:complete len:132 (+),score=12.89 GHVS01101220.1:312-707(+)
MCTMTASPSFQAWMSPPSSSEDEDEPPNKSASSFFSLLCVTDSSSFSSWSAWTIAIACSFLGFADPAEAGGHPQRTAPFGQLSDLRTVEFLPHQVLATCGPGVSLWHPSQRPKYMQRRYAQSGDSCCSGSL